jgi:hypothetical protein
MAQPFSLKQLAFSGDAVPVAENVRSVGAARRGIFSVRSVELWYTRWDSPGAAIASRGSIARGNDSVH